MQEVIKTCSIILALLLLGSPGFAQKVIDGTVRDAKTGETLPSTNIVIKDEYRGTITNSDGTYSLSIPDSLLPVTIQVRYIGYVSEQREINQGSNRQQDFELEPSVRELGEIVVTDEDLGIRIMREVIEHKQQWRSKLETYKAEAYTRQNLSNDTSLVMITESASTIFWDKQKGPREVLKWRRQTANIDADQNFAGVSYLPNFYDDNVRIAGFEVVGVTNPDAFSYYDFKLLEQLTMDGQAVYRIKVIPERDLQPLFKGEVYVLDGEYALLEVRLVPNSVVRFPAPVKNIELSYSQQYSNYGGDFWLPVDARINGIIKIGVIGLQFPRLQIRQLAKISSYQVNTELPDSLYKQNEFFTVDTTATEQDSIARVLNVEPVPLSQEEEEAYATLDSTQTLEKVFQPTGFLARFIDFSEDDSEGSASPGDTTSIASGGFNVPGRISPRLRYNRVDEFFGGLKYSVAPYTRLQVSANGGYSTGYSKFGYGAEVEYEWSAGRFKPSVGVSFNAQTVPRYQSQIIGPTITSITNILGYENYFDYYWDEGIQISVQLLDPGSDWSVGVQFNSSNQTSLETQTGYDILGQNRIPRINPAINEGRLNAFQFTLGYNLGEGYPYGVVGRNRVELNMGVSNDALDSDFNFTRYSGHIDWSFDTFYQRRVFANTLNVSLDAGTFAGQLPMQELGIVDVAPAIFSPFEGLRTVRFRPYEGEQYAAINLEHNFRTIPFERLGLTYLVEQNIGMIVFAGAAKTWISDQRREQIFDRSGYIPHTTNGAHLEAGVSVNSILDLLRVDLAARLDEPAFLVGIGITRFL